jgi:hypothetical protein
MEDERGYLLVPHEPDCDGFWMVAERCGMAEIKCNSCGEVIDTVPIERAGSRLMELAGVEMMCSARCPHCGALNTFLGFTVIEAFICRNAAKGLRSSVRSSERRINEEDSMIALWPNPTRR